jgi:hypothetical protein
MAISGLLSSSDRCSLACSCTRLFSIVESNAPFTVVKIDNCHVKSTGWTFKDRVYLRSATEVHWKGLERNWAEQWRLHAVFSVLPTLQNIRLLSLYDTDINEAQQRTIFGISCLRTLVVDSCRFFLAKEPLPPSCITSLKFTHIDAETTHYLLMKLATTLETIDVDKIDDVIAHILQYGSTALHKLSSFTNGHSSITHPEILNTIKL